MNPANRTIAVTGATRGIGRALVDGLVTRGAGRIHAIARDEAALARLASDHPGRIETYAADLSDRREVASLAAVLAADAPDLSILINNAGTQMLTNLLSPDAAGLADGLAQEVDLNLTAPIALTCQLLPLLQAQPAAMLVNITSGLALAPKQS